MKVERNFKYNEYIKPITSKTFREIGMLWYVNRLLHQFGLCIYEEEGQLRPGICRFRGFDIKNDDEGYKRVHEYMRDNAEEILKDCED